MNSIGIYLERKPDAGGAYQYCLAILKALQEFPQDKYRVIAFYVHEGWDEVLLKTGIEHHLVKKSFIEKCVHKCFTVVFPTAIYRKCSKYIHPLAKALEKYKINSCIFPCGDTIAPYMNVIGICTIFDLMHRYLLNFPEICNPKIYYTREKNYRKICRLSKMILVDSEIGKKQVLECYRDYISDKNMIKILPYIAPDYVYSGIENGVSKKTVGIPEKYIFYPAQFWSHKNHKNLLLAISVLKRNGIMVNLVLCGSPKNAYDQVKQIVEKENLEKQVTLLDYVTNEEIVSLYKNARALVMPTYAGPTNIPQLEAFLLECPVATSDIFAISEQVGDAALLFNPDSILEIAECIKNLWTNDLLCEELKVKGKRQASRWGQKEFSSTLLNYIDNLE